MSNYRFLRWLRVLVALVTIGILSRNLRGGRSNLPILSRMAGKGVPMTTKVRPLTDEQRHLLALVYERCVHVAELHEESESFGSLYPKAVEMGEEQAIQEDISNEIEAQFDLMLEDVVRALEFRTPVAAICELREQVIPEKHRDKFPTLDIGGRTI